MTRLMLFGLTCMTVLAGSSHLPAEAKQLKRNNGASTIAKSGAAIHQRARAAPSRSFKQRGKRHSRSPATAANIHALSVYLQWRKCLDNMLPKCP